MYKKQNEICDHCKNQIKEVEYMHGFVFDFFFCPYCKKENKRN